MSNLIRIRDSFNYQINICAYKLVMTHRDFRRLSATTIPRDYLIFLIKKVSWPAQLSDWNARIEMKEMEKFKGRVDSMQALRPLNF